jgi:thiol-disulfide isomerase/thioredoxin
MVPYQIVISEGARYTYARIVEDRRGVLKIDGASYDVMLRPRSRSYPLYSMSDGTVMFVDHNRDGQFDQRAVLTQGGVAVASEEVSLVQPFLLDGRGFEVTHVDSAGAYVTLAPVVVAQAPSVGYDAPGLLARTFDGAERDLGDLHGKVVLVEFWSTACSFSERARPTLNGIAAQHDADGFVWLAISRETDAGEVGDFLREHPRHAEVVVADSTVWQEYNPELATPTYYVIDQDGVIRVRERGASSAEVVAKVVAELVASNGDGN